MVDEVLAELSPRFTKMYAKRGRPSIAPGRLLRALLLQVLYTIRSERQLMEQLDYNMLYRWFVGLNMDDPIWNVTVFTKNRERLLKGEMAQAFFEKVLNQARAQRWSGCHFDVPSGYQPAHRLSCNTTVLTIREQWQEHSRLTK